MVESVSGGVCLFAMYSSRSTFVWSKLRAASTRTTAWPGPTSLSSMLCTLLVVSSSIDCACCARASFCAEAPPSPPEFRTRPELSATVTWSAVSLGTDDDTRCTMASTCAGFSGEVGLVCTSTDAVGTAAFSVKTSSLGTARCTTAVCTPSMASMVLRSSPSRARW